MKVYEIISEDKEVAEAPTGALGQFGKKVAAKGLAKVGMKGKAGQIAATVDVGDEANRIKKEMQQWMSGSGIKKNELQVRDFVNFLANAGFAKKEITDAIRKNADKETKDKLATLVASKYSEITEAIDMRTADRVIKDLVQKGFKKQAGGKQARSKYATQAGGDKKAGSGEEDLKKAADMLKKAGYNISK